ncbi:MAG: MBOAT family O-acyltransferase [Pseudomonadota bacterium]
MGFLVLGSLFFYGYWKPEYLLLILFSIGFNYFVGRLLSSDGPGRSKVVLVFGVAVNLGLLGYFKYANFFIENVNAALGTHWDVGTIFLPLAISFFTFQQISYLVDAWQGKTREYNFLHYCLFVCFFPQLIAGPIVHHKEVIPQFMNPDNLSPRWSNFAVGLSIFAIGLFKKTVIADSLSAFVIPVYDAGPDVQVDFFRAWGSTLAYTFQLYFDFSGYSDMAIGAARMFGVRLPLNFFSPYKSTSIIEFWRRWHITLSRFLRDYLYISLGGNRKGKIRRYVNLFLTMLLGGLWHGAGWPFLVWGGLHGSYLMVNHGWRHLLALWRLDIEEASWYRAASWLVTFVAVVFAWVYFRAPTLEQGNHIARAMLGFSGFEIPAGLLARVGSLGEWLQSLGILQAQGGGSVFVQNYSWVIVAGVLALFAPNVAQIFHRYDPVLYENERAFLPLRRTGRLSWDYSGAWAFVVAMAVIGGVLTLLQVSEFLYFQF